MSQNAISQGNSSQLDIGIPYPSIGEAARYWLKLGLISFGGPAGQISLMHHDVVQKRKWITDAHFLDAMNFCMLLPGPEAQQLATYLGWRLHGIRGGLMAGLLFIAPAALLLYILSWVYMVCGELPWIAAFFHGLSAAVIADVLQATLRIGSRTLNSPALWLIAVLAFLAIFVFQISYVLILMGAAAIGWLGSIIAAGQFVAKSHHQGAHADSDVRTVRLTECPKVTWQRTCRILLIGLVLWWGPVFAAVGSLGWHSTPVQQGLFFSKAALVTFGGAYAVLPYVA
ncbi:MAG TPA: chromate transporter, partial [Planctomycetaceae bacterium]|nr:chromate transporter [Planctomycetaceae bacterium]